MYFIIIDITNILNEKTFISDIGSPDLSFFYLALFRTAAQKVGVVLSGGGAERSCTYRSTQSYRRSRYSHRLYRRHQYGIYYRRIIAIGYTPPATGQHGEEQDWTFLLSDRIKRSQQTMSEREKSETFLPLAPKRFKGAVIKGQNLANLFSDLTVGYHDSIDFNKLPIPFACVSENVVNGKEIVFHDGVLSTAMRASMAIPHPLPVPTAWYW